MDGKKVIFVKKFGIWHKLFCVLMFIGSVLFLKNVLTKHVIISGNSKFYRIIKNPKYNLAVAMFYESCKSQRKDMPEKYKKSVELSDMFKRASCIFRYDDADLMFLAINLDDKRNQEIKNAFEVNACPRFMLIKDGQIYKDKYGLPLTLTGFVKRTDLQKFIDANFETQIMENRDRNREIREKKAEENLANSYGCGWGGWYPYGPGYWDCGFGPYWGGGMGFGGGCGGGFGGCYGGFATRASCSGSRGGCGYGRGSCGGSCRSGGSRR